MTSDPIGLGGGLNTYGYVGGNPLMYVDDPKGLVYGLGSNPYSQATTINKIANDTRIHMDDADVGSRFMYGFEDFWDDVLTPVNPYENGSCLYYKRLLSEKIAQNLISVASDHSDVAVDIVYKNLIKNKAYIAGCSAGNVTVSITVALLARGRMKNPTIGKSLGVSAGTGLSVFTIATYARIVKTVDSKFPKDICERLCIK